MIVKLIISSIKEAKNIVFVIKICVFWIYKYIIQYGVYLCLRNKTTRRFNIVYGLCANLWFSSTRVAWWLINKNVIFLLSSLNICLPFGFVFISMRSWESWNFRILCIKKSKEVYAQNINEWRKSKRSVVLLRSQRYN